MQLTPAQYTVIAADILANADMNTVSRDNYGCQTICDLYNAPSTTDVWATSASVNTITDGIDWSKFTPVDGADGTVSYTNRALLIQTKQMNLQLMLQGRTTIDASKANIRAGLRDAVINLPAGVSGAPVSASGASGINVLNALTRKATRLEKLFASAGVATGSVTAGILIFEGTVSNDQMQSIRGI